MYLDFVTDFEKGEDSPTPLFENLFLLESDYLQLYPIYFYFSLGLELEFFMYPVQIDSNQLIFLK